MEQLKKFLEDTNKKTFLDIGTGAGNFVGFIDELYKGYDKIIGIDLWERGIEAAKKRNENEKVSFEIMDASKMKYEDNSFDVVCLSNSLHHLEDIPLILNEMRRVLKKDGYIIINEMLNNDLDEMQLSHLKLHHFSAKIDRLSGDIHNETYSKDEVLEKIQDGTGLNVFDIWELDVPRREENSEEEMDYLNNIMDRVMARVPEEHKEELEKEKEEIKKYINEHGYDGCTSLLVLLTK